MRNSKKRVSWRVAQVVISSLVGLAIVGAFVWATQGRDMPVLNPKGIIADQQQVLILITVGLGIFVVVPVFILLFAIAFRYRVGNTKAKYDPELEGSKVLEAVWWGICLLYTSEAADDLTRVVLGVGRSRNNKNIVVEQELFNRRYNHAY